ncbi:Cell division coordinator CpoB [Candidatus Entotheonellaceae bacterium PAL068K]
MDDSRVSVLSVAFCRFVLWWPVSSWVRGPCRVLLCGLSGLLIAGCPSWAPPGPLPSRTQPSETSLYSAATTEQQQAFTRAQRLRASGQLSRAHQAFTHFVQRYPSSMLTDDALLALGRLATALGNDREAQRTYSTLVSTFPTSERVPEAVFELGMSFYHTQDNARSQTALERFLTLSTSLERRAVAHFYLGVIAAEQQRYTDAIVELTLSITRNPDVERVSLARERLSRTVREHLSLTELQQLASQYATTYPGDLMLTELARRYREAGNDLEEMATLHRFTTAFPDHSEAQQVVHRLRDLQASLTTDRSKIGVLLPLSGEGSRFGQSALRGIELALAVWRDRHPDLQLSLVIRDSHSNGAMASNALRSLVGEAHVIGVVGPLFSRIANHLVQLADQLQIPLISPYAPSSSFPAQSTYAFRNSITDAPQALFLARYAIQTLNLSRFVVLYADEPYGITLKDAFIEQVVQLQGEVVAAVPYPPDATDFSPQIRLLGSLRDKTLYDAIFIPGYYDKAALIASELAFFSITGVQLLGTDGWNNPELIDIGERFVEGAIFVDGFFAESPAPAVQAFVHRFQARYHEVPSLWAAQAYDTVEMIAEALRQGAATRAQLRDALLGVENFAGISGTTTIQPSGEADKILYLLTVAGGKIIQLN